MIYVVETARVAAGNVEAYLQAIEEILRPRAEAAGLDLVACWHTPGGIGPEVEISWVMRFADWEAWDGIRRRMLVDAELGRWHAERRRLARCAERRFCEPAAFSPLS